MKKNKNNLESIKVRSARKIFITILWLCLFFLVYRGILSIVKVDKSSSIKKEVLKEQENAKKTADSKNKAVSFAMSFVEDYFTFYGDEKEYLNRISDYTNLEFKNPLKEEMMAISTNYIDHNWINNNLILVDCKVSVNTNLSYLKVEENVNSLKTPTPTPKPKKPITTKTKQKIKTPAPTKKPVKTSTLTIPPKPTFPIKQSEKKNSQTKIMATTLNKSSIQNHKMDVTFLVSNKNSFDGIKDIKTYYIRIPINIEKGLAVCDYPTFISKPLNGSVNDKQITGKKIDNSEEEEKIKEFIKKFLEAYYVGDMAILEYFFEGQNFYETQKENIKFKGIDNIVINQKGNEYFIRCIYDVDNFKQTMEFILIKENGKYLIRKYNVNIF